MRQVSTAVYASLQLALLCLWCLPKSTVAPSICIASAALGLTSALVIGLVSHFEHKRSIRPSFLVSLYILITLLFDIARARTHWLMRQRDSIAAILTAIVGLKLAMLVIESIEKRNILSSAYKNVSTESTSGLFNRALFCWLNPLLLKGYISVLSAENLFPITENLSSIEVVENLQRGWQASTAPSSYSL